MKKICRILSAMFILTLCLSINVYAVTDEEVIKTMADEKIMEGTNNGFEPDKTLSRAEAATIVVRMKEMDNEAVTASDFVDVDKDHWAYKYISIAAKENIVEGIGENKFDPDREVTVCEAVTMLMRAVVDQDTINSLPGTWPNNFMNYAKNKGLLDGVDKGNTVPITRIETARIIYNIKHSPYWSKEEETKDDQPIYEDEDGTIKKSIAAGGVIVSKATMADNNNEIELATPGKIILLEATDKELLPGIAIEGTYVTFWLSGTRMWDLDTEQKITGITSYQNMAKVIKFGDGVVRLIRRESIEGNDPVNASKAEYLDANSIIFLACDEMESNQLDSEVDEDGHPLCLKEFDNLRLGSEFDIELCDDYNDNNMTYNEMTGTEVFFQSIFDKKGNEKIVAMTYVVED